MALKSLQFSSMSEKRVRRLVTQHVQGLPLSSVVQANLEVRGHRAARRASRLRSV